MKYLKTFCYTFAQKYKKIANILSYGCKNV